jgi:hypothetical protein
MIGAAVLSIAPLQPFRSAQSQKPTLTGLRHGSARSPR